MSLKLSREEWEQATGVRDEIRRLTARVEELERAVKPFADAAAKYDNEFLFAGRIGLLNDDEPVDEADVKIRIGDLRLARTTLSAAQDDPAALSAEVKL